MDLLRQSSNDDDCLTILFGGAAGADALGERYAKEKEISLSMFEADWNKYGKKAGIMRNEEMAEVAMPYRYNHFASEGYYLPFGMARVTALRI